MKNFFAQFKKDKGFAMLFTVLVISVILSIALGISDLTFKQTLLSNSAKNSQLAFYQADSGVECAMYYDLTLGQLSHGTVLADAPQQITCGGNTASLVSSQSTTDYFVYQEDIANNNPCYSIIFDKTYATSQKDVVSSRGFSTCQANPQQVERGLSVSY
ncbi:MAG: seg [Candidatus Nomurabacteria bacterium]|nr:seg [Candidatus Nomurabacteria bacterium]